MRENDRHLLEEWEARGLALAAYLEAHGAADDEYRVDLSAGAFHWIDKADQSSVIADARVLCTYAMSNQTVAMAWANPSLADSATIAPIEGMRGHVAPCSELEAFALAARAATAVGAEYLYRAPSPQLQVFLGLWRVRPAPPGTTFEARSPLPYVEQVLKGLIEVLRDEAEPVARLARLLDNYGATFAHDADHTQRGSNAHLGLHSIGHSLRTLSDKLAEPLGPDTRAQCIAQLQSLLLQARALARHSATEPPP